MKSVPLSLLSLYLLILPSACAQQARPDLYNCEGCEAIYEYDSDSLDWQTTISSEEEAGEPLLLRGTVYETDGSTPAEGVVIYAYHTDADGIYPTRNGDTGWARRHGSLRGWVKTDSRGRYQFRTIRPAPYPGRDAPAHIHMTVKESNRPAYWIDEVVFENDAFVTAAYRRAQHGRGGSGIVALARGADGVWQGTRDIILERHPENR